LFQRFCAPEDHYDLVVLKGGPGVGKSTLMKKIGAACEERGEDVEYLHCSGDPDSLDGVHIPRIATAVVDGTAPHVIEPKYPAAADRYVNLGQFYDIARAKESRGEIVSATTECSACYQRAYRAFAAAEEVTESAAELLEMDPTRLLRRCDGIIARELKGRGSGGADAYRFLGSLTCEGPVWCFESAQALCPKIYQIQDSWGFAAPMLLRLRESAKARGYAAVICLDPEHTERIQHLLIPELGLGFVTSREGMEYRGKTYRRIRVDAMASHDVAQRHKARLRFAHRMARELREEGMEELRRAKSAHDALESAYHPYVDFAGVDALVRQETERLTGYLSLPQFA
jgi:hypothetical protein